ncbi:MAG: DMT family transporter [Agarilytica sp.]
MLTHPMLPVVTLITTCTFWGLSWMPLKYFSSVGIEGLSLLFVTHTILALIIFPFALPFPNLSGRAAYIVGIALAGGMGIFSFTYALMYGDVVRVMVLFYLLPIWGVIGGSVFLKEKIGLRRGCGVAIALSGAFLILGGSKILTSPPTWIDGLALLSGFSFAMNNILFRGVGQLCLPMKLFAMFVGCALVTGILIAVGLESIPSSVTSIHWGLLLLYTLTWLLFANFGSQWAVERMEAGRSSIIIIVQLVAAVLSAMIVGGEYLDLWEWLGCFMVIGAALLEVKPEHK